MKARTHSAAGFSLVELTLAIGVAAVSLLVIFALLPVGVQTNQRSIERTASADILSAVAADLRATPVPTPRGSATTSPQFNIPIPANPVSSPGPTPTTLYFNSQGQSSTSVQPDSRYLVTVTFLPNGSVTRTATFADLKATWPARATLANAQGTAEMFAAFDRN